MIVVGVIAAILVLSPLIVNAFLRNVNAGEIRLVSWMGGALKIYRGPCKALMMPPFTVSRTIPAQAINVDIEITDQTADLDPAGRPAPVKVTVRASAIVSVGEDEAMVQTAANKFFSKPPAEQLSTLTDVLSSAGRRAINLLKHDQLFNSRGPAPALAGGGPQPALRAADRGPALPSGRDSTSQDPEARALAATARALPTTPEPQSERNEDDELAIIIKEACSRELMDLGLSFNSLNIKAVLSEVADARRRESAARAKASADVVQAQEEQRSRIAQLEAQQKVNDQERALNVQIASNAASIARAEAERQAAVREQREAELNASQITQARADAEQNIIRQEAEGKAMAARIRQTALAEADAIRQKAEALATAGQSYLDLRRLELAPEMAEQIAAALAQGQFVNFGGGGGQSAAATGSDDVLRVVQTILAAQVVTGNDGLRKNDSTSTPRTVPSVSSVIPSRSSERGQ